MYEYKCQIDRVIDGDTVAGLGTKMKKLEVY